MNLGKIFNYFGEIFEKPWRNFEKNFEEIRFADDAPTYTQFVQKSRN